MAGRPRARLPRPGRVVHEAFATLGGAGQRGGVTQVGLAGAASLLPGALWTMFATFFPSVAEDIVTRGFLMRTLPRLSRRWLFVVISAGVYVLSHIYRLANGPSEWLMLFCFGLAYGAEPALFLPDRAGPKQAIGPARCARISRVARVVKLVDTRDLKSRVRNGVPVRFRSRAPTASLK